MSLLSTLRFALFPRKNSRPNIGLYGDLDDVECLEDVERQFSVRFTDEEAEAVTTVGSFYQALLAKRPDLDQEPAWNELAQILALHGEVPASQITPEMEFFRHV
ncbi:hypothetical protein [Neotabrizicola sp. sgz301269]|uniref:hypothetical protein n=1 Tax=Neotabrizicola sp. sgz301269 TaxID=3276282 RepID=UPI00376F516E